ncbi:30S ribosomal protein S21 (modular protein) [Rhizobium mesoamericanum STM3625]|uniref:Small ribosomal subunit protein bS21 n=1 Tax=Rhizobium mesoamericanum STM3625 TaxID=1211777 RepID=K0PWW7_9HYPH|nr:30S ribosomal protein S21 (modular protein) [Rhizobium mesoamericanum STM3625]
MQVIVRDNNVEQAMRALKKKMQREGLFREMKERRSYEKPSERRGTGDRQATQSSSQDVAARRSLDLTEAAVLQPIGSEKHCRRVSRRQLISRKDQLWKNCTA